MADALRDELLTVPGIAGAEVETGEGVAGVRVQLALGADAAAVGTAVREILIQHGMRPAEEVEEVVVGPPPPPGAPGSVVSFPLVGEHAKSETASDAAELDQPAAGPPPAEEAPQYIAESPPNIAESSQYVAESPSLRVLESAAVEETSAGLTVVLRLSDGEVAEAPVGAGLAGLDAAVVQAVADLSGSSPVRLLEINEANHNDAAVLTVVLATAHGDVAGAAIQSGGRAFAVARAAWAALKSPV